MIESEPGKDGTLKIGAVARLTGLSVHTIRKWEQRYGAVVPNRTPTGKRLYGYQDVERLTLIKNLAERGFSLQDIARQPTTELVQARDRITPGSITHRSADPVRVAVLGTGLAATVARRGAMNGQLELAVAADDTKALLKGRPSAGVDVLMFECASYASEMAPEIRKLMAQLGASAAVLVYRFAASADLAALDSSRIGTLRAPVDPATLEQTLLAVAGVRRTTAGERDYPQQFSNDAEIPPPRLSRRALSRLAEAVPRVKCECPTHLVELILSLRAFEEYSARCENNSPADAQLHHYLWQRTAQARAIIEEVTERVAEAEGVNMDG